MEIHLFKLQSKGRTIRRHIHGERDRPLSKIYLKVRYNYFEFFNLFKILNCVCLNIIEGFQQRVVVVIEDLLDDT